MESFGEVVPESQFQGQHGLHAEVKIELWTIS